MTSNINPNNIDGAYPVAGQDNNSQGFRTNFTNTATNFQYAADEITDLQNNAILKSALTGTTLDNNMQGSLLYNAQLQQMSETVVALGTNTTGSVTIDFANGSYQTVTTSTSLSLGFANWPAAGTAGSITVAVTVSSTAHTLTFPGTVSVNANGIQGITSGVITFAAVGTYTFTFVTSNGGGIITVFENNKALQPFNASGQSLTNGGTVNLGRTGVDFTPTGAWTSTLPNGVYGQIITINMVGNGGSMVMTATTAGWKTSGSGTITFSSIGSGCTLRWHQNAWYCIGNNGAVFA
jgi:hypothetical protein